MKYIGILNYSDLESGIWTLEDKQNTYHLALDDSMLTGLKSGDTVEIEADSDGGRNST